MKIAIECSNKTLPFDIKCNVGNVYGISNSVVQPAHDQHGELLYENEHERTGREMEEGGKERDRGEGEQCCGCRGTETKCKGISFHQAHNLDAFMRIRAVILGKVGIEIRMRLCAVYYAYYMQ